LKAIGAKAKAILGGGQAYLAEPSRKKLALEYLELVGEIRQLENQINRIYTDPNIDDPDVVSGELQRELADRRDAMAQIQPVAEAIVQDQVADVLEDEAFEVLNQAWPPVMMHMTPLPSILIVSPRDRIDRIYGIPLINGLPTPVRDGLESAVFDDLNLSALVVPIGGLGIYPSMIVETSSINRLAEVTAHEWAHHWLGPYPISLYYGVDPVVRTMNETVASIVGNEVGKKMIERYYPEFAPPPPAEGPPTAEIPPSTDTPPPFNFQAEMAETRAKVDELLADGKIEEAETYMENRRRFLVENGYGIRKLNQAYFAFHGAYADEPGATGENPIGPMLLELRAQSRSLREFMQSAAPVNSFEELKEVLETSKSGSQ
jgi:hypothetical protein